MSILDIWIHPLWSCDSISVCQKYIKYIAGYLDEKYDTKIGGTKAGGASMWYKKGWFNIVKEAQNLLVMDIWLSLKKNWTAGAVINEKNGEHIVNLVQKEKQDMKKLLLLYSSG